MEQRLAQPNALMFERNMIHIARRGREVEVWLEGLPEPKVGFLSGLDDDFLQLCLTKSQVSSNVARDMIISVDETGRTLGALTRDSRGTPDEQLWQRVKVRVERFQNKAAAIVAGRIDE